jgi:putative superfamily III holin-X
MANTNDNVKYQVASPEAPNWPELVSKTVDDLTRIVRTEIELAEVSLKRVIEAQADKAVGLLFLLVALIYGSLFLLGGVVLLIHLWLDWWLSFLITGVAIVAAGVVFQMRMAALGRQKSR